MMIKNWIATENKQEKREKEIKKMSKGLKTLLMAYKIYVAVIFFFAFFFVPLSYAKFISERKNIVLKIMIEYISK